MTPLQLIVLSVVQGITEFLPISSSGHLILTSKLAGWPDESLKMDVAVHLGTLGAVLIYFWRDIRRIALDLLLITRPGRRPGARLGLYILLATLPVLLAGGLVAALAPNLFRDPFIIALATIGFGLVLYLADRFGVALRGVEDMTLRSALIIGCAQALAVIPGTSRAGITMTAARFVGFERTAAARFSMLLSIPVILAAGAVAGYGLHEAGDAALTLDAVLGAGLAFAVALLAIWFLMRLIQRVSFTPFVVYRLVLGAGLLLWLYR